jgi:integrase
MSLGPEGVGISLARRPILRVPKLHRHKASRRGFVRVAGASPVYFRGDWPPSAKRPPPAIQRQYLEWLELWQAEQLEGLGQAAAALDPVALPPATAEAEPGRRPGKPLKVPCISEVWELYDQRNAVYYRKDGRITSERGSIQQACRLVDRLFGMLPAHQFTAKHLLAVRAEMIRAGWCRSNINDQVSRVRSMFRWAAKVEQSLIPMAVYHGLTEMDALRRGRCDVRESARVRAVTWEAVERSLPLLGPVVQLIVRVHWLIGCRSQDVVSMRPDCLETTGPVWRYYPEGYKTAHHEHLSPLVYCVGPRAQEILAPLLEASAEPAAWLFRCRANRGTKGRYDTQSYRYHVTRRLDAAPPAMGLARWVPRQLRHGRLTEIRKLYGVEVAQLVAQHQHMKTTEVYAEADLERPLQVMREIG